MNIYEMRRAYALQAARTHAAIRAEIANHQRYGQQPPAELYRQLQRIESNVNQLLPPDFQQHTRTMSNYFEHQMHQQAEQQYQQQHQQDIANGVNRAAATLSENMNTPQKLNGQQFAQVMRGEKVKLSTGKPKLDMKAVETLIMKNTGKNFSQRVSDLDDLEHIRKTRSEKDYQAALKKHGATDAQVDIWAKHGLGLMMFKKEAERRKDDPDFEEWQPDDNSVRKAQFVDAWIEKTGEVPVSEEIDPGYLNHSYTDENGERQTSLAGDIANAMDTCIQERINNG